MIKVCVTWLLSLCPQSLSALSCCFCPWSHIALLPYFDKKSKDGKYINSAIMLSILRPIGCLL